MVDTLSGLLVELATARNDELSFQLEHQTGRRGVSKMGRKCEENGSEARIIAIMASIKPGGTPTLSHLYDKICGNSFCSLSICGITIVVDVVVGRFALSFE
jgi:hypothetical protein